jgi:hypothetical protein
LFEWNWPLHKQGSSLRLVNRKVFKTPVYLFYCSVQHFANLIKQKSFPRQTLADPKCIAGE